MRQTLRKARPAARQGLRRLPGAVRAGLATTLAANATANLARNLWSHSVIMCGHFPEGVETFEQEELDEHETRGEWYLRQMLGSADISGGPLLHLMTGNLSHQIEHHIYPDLPSNRYGEIAAEVEDLFERYGLSYNSRPLVRQVALGLAPGRPAVAAQRLARGDQPQERRSPAGGARSDGEARGPEPGVMRAAQA